MPGFQTYLDNAERQTGITPRQFIALAQENGLTGGPAGAVIAWLKTEHGLGHGHAANLAQLIGKDPAVLAEKYNGGVPLRLDGVGTDGGS